MQTKANEDSLRNGIEPRDPNTDTAPALLNKDHTWFLAAEKSTQPATAKLRSALSRLLLKNGFRSHPRQVRSHQQTVFFTLRIGRTEITFLAKLTRQPVLCFAHDPWLTDLLEPELLESSIRLALVRHLSPAIFLASQKLQTMFEHAGMTNPTVTLGIQIYAAPWVLMRLCFDHPQFGRRAVDAFVQMIDNKPKISLHCKWVQPKTYAQRTLNRPEGWLKFPTDSQRDMPPIVKKSRIPQP